MSRRFVDLSIYLENDVITDPPFMRPKIEYVAHRDTMNEARHFHPTQDGGKPSMTIDEVPLDWCFPHKIRGASAGWTRAVAIFEE